MVDANETIEVFKNALMDESILVQVDAIRRLPSLASSMDAETTREELIPCIDNFVDALPDESCFNLAEQLERLVPFVGGNDHIGVLLDILVRLASEDEFLVRDRAITAMKNIYVDLTEEQCQKSFYPLVEHLINNDWFTTKCSAGCLIVICYPKMSLEIQTELRNYFRNLIQDESPMVRRSTAKSLVDFLPLLDPEVVISEFVPIFDNLSDDDQDSVRTLAVDVGVAISKLLKDFEIYEYLLGTFGKLSEDLSWRVRQRVSLKTAEIPATEKTREEIINIYRKCVRDDEPEVRVYAAKNVYNFSVNLLEGYKNDQGYEEAFERQFEETVVPEIYHMLRDGSEDVRVALSTNILSLRAILRSESFNSNILPLIIDALENEEFIEFKENMLKNLNLLPTNVDITKSIKCMRQVLQNLMENSQMQWRTRRNLLMAFIHISRNTSSEYFDKNLKSYYKSLLGDPIYAIRRTSPVILPLLIKRFGTKWTKDSLIPIVLAFATDSRYLFRYVTLFAIEELIEPTLEPDKSTKYLEGFREHQENKDAVEALARIAKLNAKLKEKIEDDIPEIDENYVSNDSLNFYSEDTLEFLKQENDPPIYSVAADEVNDSYLESVLVILVRNFAEVVRKLVEDPIENVQNRAKITLEMIRNFCSRLQEAVSEVWVQQILESVNEYDMTKIGEDVENKLAEEVKMEEDEEEDEEEEEEEEEGEEEEEVPMNYETTEANLETEENAETAVYEKAEEHLTQNNNNTINADLNI